MPTVQLQSLRQDPEATAQFYLLYRKIRTVQYAEKRVRYLPFASERHEGTGLNSKTKKLQYEVCSPEVLFPRPRIWELGESSCLVKQSFLSEEEEPVALPLKRDWY